MKRYYIPFILSVLLAACGKKDQSLKSFFYTKKVTDMSYDEAKENFEYYKSSGRNDLAAKCLQHMITVSDDHATNAKNRLALIALYFEDQKYEKAQIAAREFQNLYPSSPHVVRAAYDEILATFNLINIPDRDQTNTVKTTELAKEFLEKFPSEQYGEQYKTAVKDMLSICYETLYQSEVGVFESYIHKHYNVGNEPPLHAARGRVDYIKEHLAEHINNGFARVIDLEIKLAKVENKEQIVEQKIKQLQKDYPNYVALNI